MLDAVLNRCFNNIGSFFVDFEPLDRNHRCMLYLRNVQDYIGVTAQKKIIMGGKLWESILNWPKTL